ncbi:hypothetical protein NDU88_003961 [Pleurodeles waltl]|uniref:Uncharacterized protein n=1 Tax=Pleurodeles waltl TaxID=8319 RepID=A0AAV7QGY8_PLEWA|nr:hypothetical protein NDU88_003961 [Pleurodeles waltl]
MTWILFGLRGIWMPQGRCSEILGMQVEVTGAASIRWAMQGNFCCMASAASIRLTGSRAVLFRLAMRQSGGPCIEVPVATLMLYQSPLRRCSLFGPETSGSKLNPSPWIALFSSGDQGSRTTAGQQCVSENSQVSPLGRQTASLSRLQVLAQSVFPKRYLLKKCLSW